LLAIKRREGEPLKRANNNKQFLSRFECGDQRETEEMSAECEYLGSFFCFTEIDWTEQK
jgi:hypothetical protein